MSDSRVTSCSVVVLSWLDGFSGAVLVPHCDVSMGVQFKLQREPEES